MERFRPPRFEGWYFKHQGPDGTVALIPGRAGGAPFVQLLTDGCSRQFSVPSLETGPEIRAGACRFGRNGVWIDLPGVHGAIRYGPLTPLRSDIMGPFRHLPMECRHGVVSMRHRLEGALELDGKTLRFDGGLGYLERDSGTSFPSRYLWLQANDFPGACSIMLAVARIPFAGLQFDGCICAILCGAREYRLATYRGVRVLAAGPEHIRLAQGKLLLQVDVRQQDAGLPLCAPVRGRMTAVIRESSSAQARFRLWEGGVPVLDLTSAACSFEYRP